MRSETRGLVLALSALPLAACISLFPKEQPAQLYRFEDQASAEAPPSVSASSRPTVTIRQGPTTFDRASAGDRILTTQGARVAYLAGARWVEPAAGLFDAAVQTAFHRAMGSAILLGHGEAASGDARLTLDVRTFEARYTNGPGSPPTAMVEVDAILRGPAASSSRREHLFRAEAPAEANRIDAIVKAYDIAVTKALSGLVAWTEMTP